MRGGFAVYSEKIAQDSPVAAASTAPPGREPLRPGQYLVIFLLLFVPLLNLFLLFWWSFGSAVNLNRKNFARAVLIFYALAAVLLTLLFIIGGEFYLPTPTDEQIAAAVAEWDKARMEPESVEMTVPTRYPGRARVVLRAGDEDETRNYDIAYDRKTKSFYVEDCVIY